MSHLVRTVSVAMALAALMSTSCFDPVHADAVDALGGEKGGERPGPTHRAGQPCLTCHGGAGPGSPEFAIAGTVYATRSGTEALTGAEVMLQDATGAKQTFATNRVGNFYVPKTTWNPSFPLVVRVDFGGKKAIMKTRIGGKGACAACHDGPRPDGDATRVPPVFFEDK